MRKLWLFRVTGGKPFQMQIKGNPPMKHDGGSNAVLRSLCTEKEAEETEAAMVALGCRVFRHCPMETKEQTKERENVLSVLGGDREVFPCAQCPGCSWFDPHLESLCGAGRGFGDGWEPEAVKGVMTSEKFVEDLKACPRPEGLH